MSEDFEFMRVSEIKAPQQRDVALLFQQLVAQCRICGLAKTIIHNNKKYCLSVKPQQLQLTVDGVRTVVMPDGFTYETRDYGIFYRMEDVCLNSLMNVLNAFLQSSRIAELVELFIERIRIVSGTSKEKN